MSSRHRAKGFGRGRGLNHVCAATAAPVECCGSGRHGTSSYTKLDVPAACNDRLSCGLPSSTTQMHATCPWTGPAALTACMPRRNGYFYYERTEEGKQYTVYCRRKVKDESSASKPQVAQPLPHACICRPLLSAACPDMVALAAVLLVHWGWDISLPTTAEQPARILH